MKILRASYRIPPMPGGLERHVGCLTTAQLRHGHTVDLAFRHGTDVPAGAGVLTPRPTTRSRLLGVRSDVAAFGAEVASALRRGGPYDLVHLHGDHLTAALIGPACASLGIPLVLTVHGALSQRYQWLARRAFGTVTACIALGNRPTRDLIRAGVPAARIRTMSSGLDLVDLAATRASVTTEPGLVVSGGSLDPVKDHALTIEAVRRLRADRPAVRLMIIGDGPERDRLDRLTGGDAGIELVGHLPTTEVWRAVASAEVFVLASRLLASKGEGVPTAALEALGLGTPAVLSTAASLDPVVADDGTYQTFRAESVDDLTRVLGGVLDDPVRRRLMVDQGLRAVAALDWSEQASTVEQWYHTALDTAPRHRRAVTGAEPARL